MTVTSTGWVWRVARGRCGVCESRMELGVRIERGERIAMGTRTEAAVRTEMGMRVGLGVRVELGVRTKSCVRTESGIRDGYDNGFECKGGVGYEDGVGREWVTR